MPGNDRPSEGVAMTEVPVSRDDLEFIVTQLQAHVASDAGIYVDVRRCNETAARLRVMLHGTSP